MTAQELLAFATLVIRETARAFNVSPSEILGSSRQQTIAGARLTAMALLREKTNLTQQEVADIFNKKKPSSVAHAEKKLPQLESCQRTASITQTIRTALAFPKELSRTPVHTIAFSHSFLKSNLIPISDSSQSLSL